MSGLMCPYECLGLAFTGAKGTNAGMLPAPTAMTLEFPAMGKMRSFQVLLDGNHIWKTYFSIT